MRRVLVIALAVAVAGVIAVRVLVADRHRAPVNREAAAKLEKMADAVQAEFARERPTGPTHRCPGPAGSGSLPATPPFSTPCHTGPDGECVPVRGTPKEPWEYPSALWNDAIWSEMNFAMEEPHHFHYVYRWNNASTGYGECQFTVQAFGDLDGDGIYSTYERSGAADLNGVDLLGLFRDNEVE